MIAALLISFIVSSCAVKPERAAASSQASASGWLFDATAVIDHRWQHLPLRGKTEYRMAVLGGQVAIRAVGRSSASGLIRRVDIDTERCPTIEWSWAISELQRMADLRVKELEDVAASLFLLFGDPGFFSDPKPVPTLRYVWTNGHATVGEVIDNPYLPGVVRSIVVRSGNPHSGTWQVERRNLLEDFESAFGHRPGSSIRAIALFTDNDQTKEPVEAYYGRGRVFCRSGATDEKPIGIN